jgi:hypothetical protein
MCKWRHDLSALPAKEPVKKVIELVDARDELDDIVGND